MRTFFSAAIMTVLIGCSAFSTAAMALDLQSFGLRAGISDNRNFVFYDANPGLNLHMLEIGYLFKKYK